jgi:hypothetical protein
MTTENGARKRHPARRARTVAAGLGAAAVLGLAGIMGYGDWRGRPGDDVPVAQVAPAAAVSAASAPPLVENEPIQLRARRVVRTVTVRGSAPASSGGVSRGTTAQPTAPVVTTGGSN